MRDTEGDDPLRALAQVEFEPCECKVQVWMYVLHTRTLHAPSTIHTRNLITSSLSSCPTTNILFRRIPLKPGLVLVILLFIHLSLLSCLIV